MNPLIRQKQEIVKTINNHEDNTGLVTFPDNDSLKVQFICHGNCSADLLNSVDICVEGHFHVSEIKNWSDESFIVELER